MISCPSCHRENADDAKYCTQCGAVLTAANEEPQLEKNIENFAEEMEKIGKKIEKKGKNIETWYDTKFGLFGPILSALVAFILLYIGIQLLTFFGSSRPWMASIGQFLDEHLMLFLFVFLVSGISHYLSKKYPMFRFFSPVVGAIIFLIWFWVVLQILQILSSTLNIEILGTLARIGELLLIPLAVLILLVGYLGVVFSKIHNSHTTMPPRDKTPPVPPQEKQGEYQRLYRSGKDRLLGGICGGIAEYFRIDPVIIRVVFVVGAFFSFGFIIISYFILWVIVPRNPSHNW